MVVWGCQYCCARVSVAFFLSPPYSVPVLSPVAGRGYHWVFRGPEIQNSTRQKNIKTWIQCRIHLLQQQGVQGVPITYRYLLVHFLLSVIRTDSVKENCWHSHACKAAITIHNTELLWVYFHFARVSSKEGYQSLESHLLQRQHLRPTSNSGKLCSGHRWFIQTYPSYFTRHNYCFFLPGMRHMLRIRTCSSAR